MKNTIIKIGKINFGSNATLMKCFKVSIDAPITYPLSLITLDLKSRRLYALARNAQS